MSDSRYEMQIVEIATGRVASSWPPRKPEHRGPFIDALCLRLEAKGIGYGKSTAHVLEDLRQVFQEICREAKTEVGPS